MKRLVRPLSILLTVGSIPTLIVVLGVLASQHSSSSHTEHPALLLIPGIMFAVGASVAVYSGRLDKRAGRDRRLGRSGFDAETPRGQRVWSQMLASRQREVGAQAAKRPEEFD